MRKLARCALLASLAGLAVACQTAEASEPKDSKAGVAHCGASQRAIANALAIPLGDSGTIEIVLSDKPTSCAYWSNPRPAQCAFWRARIELPPEAQTPGSYGLDMKFAYLDRQLLGKKGAWQKAPSCELGGGSLRGKLEVVRVEKDKIIGRICGSTTDDARDAGLVDGSFTAQRCPACQMTGDACSSNAECCANNCSAGHCRP